MSLVVPSKGDVVSYEEELKNLKAEVAQMIKDNVSIEQRAQFVNDELVKLYRKHKSRRANLVG